MLRGLWVKLESSMETNNGENPKSKAKRIFALLGSIAYVAVQAGPDGSIYV